MGTLSNNSKVGDKGKDLVLQTSGRVYVQVKDRFYEINFRGEDEEDKEEEIEETPQVLFISSEEELENLAYPGDDYLIVTSTGKFYKTENEEYSEIPVVASMSNIFTTPITINTPLAPLNIISNQLIKNLNAEYLDGIDSNQFARKTLNETITSTWQFNNLILNKISDAQNSTLLDLINGVLTIDTINVKNLNITSESGDDNSNTSSSEIDIISRPTYFSNGLKILDSETVSKVDFYFQDSSTWLAYNENAEVGGFSISDLIISAYNDGYISDDINLSDYFNILTSAFKFNNGQWVSHTVTEQDFITNDIEDAPYQFIKFIPKDRVVFESVIYGSTSNCAIKIYDRWFNINEYVGNIKDKYQGLTFECSVESNQIKAGTEIEGNGPKGKIEGLIVGGTETKVRIIVSGIDCEFLYMTDTSEDVDDKILACQTAAEEEKGITTSADIEKGNILFSGMPNNIIGNIDGIKNSIFGTLEGYGLTSEGNCYFVNPGIALVNTDNLNYLKLYNKEQSFIGINKKNEKWITIETDGGCDMKRDKMYNINNHLSFCSFGPIRVEEDGSATIGSGETQITITADGKVQIPEACIIK